MNGRPRKWTETDQAGEVAVEAPRACSNCARGFIPTHCQAHCTPSCCRKAGCKEARPSTRIYAAGRQAAKRCVVCRAPGRYFTRFVPCDSHCVRFFYAQTRAGIGNTGRFKRVWLCWKHQPAGEPRLHVRYCSLRCFNNTELGHRAKVLDGKARRRGRWLSRGGAGKMRMRRERR